MTAPECPAAAWRYWHATVASSYRANEGEAGELEMLTPRPCQVAALLADDTQDRSRFAARARFGGSVDFGRRAAPLVGEDRPPTDACEHPPPLDEPRR